MASEGRGAWRSAKLLEMSKQWPSLRNVRTSMKILVTLGLLSYYANLQRWKTNSPNNLCSNNAYFVVQKKQDADTLALFPERLIEIMGTSEKKLGHAIVVTLLEDRQTHSTARLSGLNDLNSFAPLCPEESLSQQAKTCHVSAGC